MEKRGIIAMLKKDVCHFGLLDSFQKEFTILKCEKCDPEEG